MTYAPPVQFPSEEVQLRQQKLSAELKEQNARHLETREPIVSVHSMTRWSETRNDSDWHFLPEVDILKYNGSVKVSRSRVAEPNLN